MNSAKFLVLLLTLARSAWAGSPGAPGLYQAGELGFVDFAVEKGTWVGRFRGGGSCGFDPGAELLVGQVEGGVFAGSVLLCQAGAECPQKKYPFLGVWREGALTGNVRLDPGCSSVALEGRLLHVVPASSEDRARLLAAEGPNATELAAKNVDPREVEARAQLDIANGIKKAQAGDPRAAQELLRRGLAADPSNPLGLATLGSVQVRLGDPERGRKTLEQAIALARDRVKPPDLADMYYNLGCAQAKASRPRDAVDALRTAVKLGGVEAYREPLASDPDLAGIRQSPEYRRFYAQEIATAKDKGRKPR